MMVMIWRCACLLILLILCASVMTHKAFVDDICDRRYQERPKVVIKDESGENAIQAQLYPEADIGSLAHRPKLAKEMPSLAGNAILQRCQVDARPTKPVSPVQPPSRVIGALIVSLIFATMGSIICTGLSAIYSAYSRSLQCGVDAIDHGLKVIRQQLWVMDDKAANASFALENIKSSLPHHLISHNSQGGPQESVSSEEAE